MATTNDLATFIADRYKLDRDTAEDIVTDVFKQTGALLRSGERVQIEHFGAFFAKKRDARVGRNPATGGSVHIPEKAYLRFKAAPRLLEKVRA